VPVIQQTQVRILAQHWTSIFILAILYIGLMFDVFGVVVAVGKAKM